MLASMQALDLLIILSHRQMLALCIDKLIEARRIKTTQTDDGLLWCSVDMTRSPEAVFHTLGFITMAWGPPLLKLEEDKTVRYLFNPLNDRVRNSTN